VFPNFLAIITAALFYRCNQPGKGGSKIPLGDLTIGGLPGQDPVARALIGPRYDILTVKAIDSKEKFDLS